MSHENQRAASFSDSVQMANDLTHSARAFADRHIALLMEQERLGPECPFKTHTLRAMSESNKLIRHIEQFIFMHFQQVEFQNPAANHGEKVYAFVDRFANGRKLYGD